MTEDVSAGRLHADVYVETRGASRGLQSRLNREVADVRARIRAEIDTRGSRTQARQAAAALTREAAAANARVRLRAEIDQRALARDVARVAREVSADAVIRFRAEVDQGSVAAAQAAVSAVATDRDVNVNVNANTAAAQAAVAAVGNTPINDPTTRVQSGLNNTTRQAATAFRQVSRIPMLVGGFYTLGTAIVNVGGGLFAMAASATSAAGVLAVIPNLVGTIAQGAGVLLAGFSGVGEAVEALGKQEATAATDAGAAAQAREAAAKRVANAQRALGDAQRAAADSARQTAEAVEDANWALARSAESVRDAREALENAQYAATQGIENRAERLEAAEKAVATTQERARRAQENINRARELARERIEDLNRALRLTVADEAAAAAAVVRAQQDLQDVLADASTSGRDRTEAEVALLQAQAAYERQIDYQNDLREETAKANEEGVEGSEAVKSAVETAAEAVAAEKDARETLKDTIRENGREARDQARAVRNAEEGVRDALHAQGEAREAVADAVRNQQRAAADSARAIADARAELADARADQGAGLGELSAAATAAQTALDSLTPAGRRFARFIVNEVKPVLSDLRRGIQEALLPGVQAGVSAALPLLRSMKAPLVDTAARIGQFVRQTGQMMGSEAFRTDVTTIMGQNNRALTQFMRAGRNMIAIFKDVAVVAGEELLVPFSKWVNMLTKGWREAIANNRANGDLAETFRNAADRAQVIGNVLKNVITTLWGLGRAALDSGDDLWKSLEATTQGWSDWANDPANKEAIQEFFAGAAGILKQVGEALAGVIELFTKLSDAGQGPLMVVLGVVNSMIEALNSIADVPFIAELLGWLSALGLLLGALGTLTGMVMGFIVQARTVASTLSRALVITRNVANGTYYYAMRAKLAAYWMRVQAAATRVATAATSAFGRMQAFVVGILGRIRASIAAYRAAMAGLTLQQKIATTATMIWSRVTAAAAAIGRVFRVVAATMFGPWGIAIVAVIAAFVLLYKKVGWFRKGVQAVMRGVVAAFNWVVDGAKWLWDVLFGHSVFPDIMDGLRAFWGVVERIFGWVVGAFKAAARVATWLWKNAIGPAFNGIKAVLSAWWSGVKIYFAAWKAALGAIFTAVQWVWSKVSAVFPAIGRAVSLAWSVAKIALRAMIGAFRAVGRVVSWLWDKVIRPVFGFYRSALSVLWNRVYKPIIGFLVSAFRGWGKIIGWLWRTVVRPVFNSIGGAASTMWRTVLKPILNSIADKIETVGGWFSWLWDKAVKPAFNSIKDKIDTVWGAISPIFSALRDWAKTTLPNAFETMKKAITGAFNKVANLAIKPIKFVVETIYNDGLRKMIGYLPGVEAPTAVDTSGWKFEAATGGIIPGFTPGRDVHRFTSPSGGTLDLSGGESVMRPEWTRLLGKQRVDAMNAAARRGGNALRNTVSGLFGGHGAHARGGVIGSLGRFFLGGVVPLIGANRVSAHPLPYYSTGATWAGDLNSPGDLANPPSPVVAWKAGTVGHTFQGYGDSHGRYGNHAVVNHPDGTNAWYAHLSSLVAKVGQSLRAGQMIGRVGASGNVKPPITGAHLHFEVRGGAVTGGAGVGPGATTVQSTAKEEKEADGWRAAIGSVKDLVTKFPGWLRNLGNTDWGGYMVETAKSLGDKVRGWVNDKVPDKIKTPGPIPDIPLPDNPIPKFYDAGGSWPTGTLGINASGYTETVFTNRDMVSLGASLAATAASLKSLIAPTVVNNTGTSGPLVGELTVVAAPPDVPSVLAYANLELRKIAMGGVYARGNTP